MIAQLEKLLEVRLAGLRLAASELLDRDAPGGLDAPGPVSANRHCRILAGRGGWIALNLARDDDLDLVPALTGADAGLADPWGALAGVAGQCPAMEFRDRAIELGLPVAVVGEAAPLPLAESGRGRVPRRVVDMSALWAGPLCAGLLARAGAEVVRVDSIGRPDPTPLASPRLDARINAGKARRRLDLRTDAGRAALLELATGADVLVTSARPAALARLGLEPASLPHLTWVAITGHGWDAARVGFGDDCAAAGGLVRWTAHGPWFLGDALADPLTGLEAALAVLSGRRGLLDMAMAGVAAAYAEMLA